MSLLELGLLFARLGALSFGGGPAVLGELQRELVVDHAAMTQRQFLDAYAIGQATPGPGVLFLVPLGFYAAGLPGACVAMIAFLTPPLLVQLAVVAQWERLLSSPWVRALDRALVPISVGLIGGSLYSLGTPLLHVPSHVIGALVAGAIVLRMRVSPAVVVLAGGVLGVLGLL